MGTGVGLGVGAAYLYSLVAELLSAADGVHCITPEGELLGKILVPETVSNVAFGGPKRNRLYITGTTSLYSLYMGVQGVSYFDPS